MRSILHMITCAQELITNAFAPLQCESCNKSIVETTKVFRICDECFYSFVNAPKPERLLNELYRHREGKQTSLSGICSLFEITDESAISTIIYAIKYDGCQRMAFDLGALLYDNVKNSNVSFDMIIPIPIHHARKRERGYNQATLIAQGIASAINIRMNENVMKRIVYTKTQTTLSAEERKQNVDSTVFKICDPDTIKGKNILLIDDVFTTGATMDSCAAQILESGARCVYAATIATAHLPQ